MFLRRNIGSSEVMSFGISVIKNPIYIWDERRECDVINWDESQGDRHLNFNFDYQDFEELRNFLDIKLSRAKRREDESYIEHEERLKNQYLEVANEKGYEMLGRIWYWYESVSYLPSEIDQLLNECLKLKNNYQNPNLLTAIDKLITACNEAHKTNSGIFLGSD